MSVYYLIRWKSFIGQTPTDINENDLTDVDFSSTDSSIK